MHPFAEAVAAGDHDAAMATLADDIEFRSPAVYKPYHGKETVEVILRTVATVFENFRYTNEWRDGATTIHFLEENGDGKVAKLTVMIRPLSGLQAVSETMRARLGVG